jgi:anti-anti-sigma factor
VTTPTKAAYIRGLWIRDPWEFAVAVIVIAAELTLGVLHGIALGVVLALLLLIYRSSHPRGGVLGQLPGTEAYRNVGRHPEAITFPGMLIWRAGGDLFFASIGHVEERLKAELEATHPQARHVLLDAESVNFIDTAACETLLSFIKELQGRGVTVAFARVRDSVRERMRSAGLEAVVGSANFHERVTDGVRAWEQQERRGT